jgi:hypothetical protein
VGEEIEVLANRVASAARSITAEEKALTFSLNGYELAKLNLFHLFLRETMSSFGGLSNESESRFVSHETFNTTCVAIKTDALDFAISDKTGF